MADPNEIIAKDPELYRRLREGRSPSVCTGWDQKKQFERLTREVIRRFYKVRDYEIGDYDINLGNLYMSCAQRH